MRGRGLPIALIQSLTPKLLPRSCEDIIMSVKRLKTDIIEGDLELPFIAKKRHYWLSDGYGGETTPMTVKTGYNRD